MMRRTSISLAGILLAAILLLGFVIMLALNWPGQMSFDSIAQLEQGRSGFYHSWHPPVMAFLLGIFDHFVSGSGLFLLFTSVLALFSLLALAQPSRASGWSVVLALLVMASPQWLLYQGLIWKDVLFANSAIAGFAALALAARSRVNPSWVTLGALLFVLAAMTRQNGIVILPFAAGAYGLIMVRGLSRVRALVHAGLFLAVTLSAVIAGDLALAAHGDHGADAADELRAAQAYDLTGMLIGDSHLKLDRLERGSPTLAALLRGRGQTFYTAERIDPFQDDPIIRAAIDKAPSTLILEQWQSSVLSHPILYLKTRAPVFWWVLATPNRIACRPLFIGVDGDPAAMATLGLVHRWRPQDEFLNQYGLALVGTPFFSHLLFAVLAAGLLLWLTIISRGGADLAVAGLLASALAFAASFFIVSVACDYRYLYFLDLAALAGSLYVCARKN
jgi:hypothetical protein